MTNQMCLFFGDFNAKVARPLYRWPFCNVPLVFQQSISVDIVIVIYNCIRTRTTYGGIVCSLQ